MDKTLQCLLMVLFLLIGILIGGLGIGRMAVREAVHDIHVEAVARGHAEWEVDMTGYIFFKWNDLKDD